MSAYEPPPNDEYQPPDTDMTPEDRQRVAAMLLSAEARSPLPPGVFFGDPEEWPNPNAEMALQETMIAQADIDTDARSIAERVFDRMVERIPGWVAHDANLDTILIEEFATVTAEIRQEALNVPEAIFVTYGEQVLGIPIAPPAPAIGYSTWTAVDEQGYTVPAGLQFTLAKTGDELIVFETVAAATIPPGQASIDRVQIRAAEAGVEGNDASGPGDPIDPIVWVQSIQVDVPTAMGTNGQTVEEYLTELISLLRVIALRPILPWDFAILALRVPGVGRAVAMDGYEPSDGSWGHIRQITLILTDERGEPVPQPVKDEVRQMLEALREVNWIVRVINPTPYETVNVNYHVVAFAEQNPDIVRELCDQAVRDYLSPANFRLGTTSPAIAAGEVIPPPEPGQTPGRQTIRVNSLIALLARQRGVDWVEHDGVLIDGQHDDHQLSTPTALPRPGAITGTVDVQGIGGNI